MLGLACLGNAPELAQNFQAINLAHALHLYLNPPYSPRQFQQGKTP
jgi:hypothetical protein